MTTLLTAFDLGGTFVFALSGGAAGVKHRLDLFGVLALSFAAGNSGGIVRDVLIGALPPVAISDWRYIAASLLAGVMTFYWYRLIEQLSSPVLVLDAAGLALFAVSGAGKALITSDDQLGGTKGVLAISPDGSTVIFHTTVYESPNDKTGERRWVAMAADGGGAMRVLDADSLNLARPAMNADGSIALLDLDELVLTDGSGGLDLFPHWNIRAVHLSTDANLAMSQSGDRVTFTIQYPTFRSLYVGSVNEPGAEARAPIGITDVSLSAADDPDELVLTVATSGPVATVVVEPQRLGRLVAEKDAAWTCAGPRDDGQPPDEFAQDGRFTATCSLKADDTGGMRVAIATDAQGWVVVKDYPLFW